MIIGPDGKIIAELSETSASGGQPNPRSLLIKATQNFETAQNGVQSATLEFVAPLSPHALDHLENLRMGRPKHDLELRIRLQARLLKSRLVTAHLHEILIENLPPALRQPFEQIRSTSGRPRIESLVVYGSDPNYWHTRINMWVLSSDGGATAFEIATETPEYHYRIPSDDWVHDYLPKLTGRRYAVVELTTLPSLSGKFAEVVSSIEEAKRQLYEHLDLGGAQTALRNALNKLFEALRESELTQKGPDGEEILWGKIIPDKEIRDLVNDTYRRLKRAVTTGQEATAAHMEASRCVDPRQVEALIGFAVYLTKMVSEGLQKEANG